MERPVITVRQGRVRGAIDTSIDGDRYFAFKGIPYGKPPVGNLRFRDPEPPESWTDVRDASTFGSICAQRDMIFRAVQGSDDCLYLNVYSTTLDFAKRAVMVWIHGGAFVHGSGDSFIYGPDYLIKRDIVLVTINYRLGVLGFLNLEDQLAPGNQGLKDQVLALRWVRDNILNFGGDPENVTIFGESAGAASVHYLSLSHLADGLFHKAISQSGVALNPWASILENPKVYAFRLSERLGNKSSDPKDVLDFLRTVDCRKLVDAQERVATYEERFKGILPFAPGVDDKSTNPFFPRAPSVAADLGIRIPYLLGYNSHEGLFGLKDTTEAFYKKIDTNFEIAIHPEALSSLEGTNISPRDIKRLYFGDEPITAERSHEYAEFYGDMHFRNGIFDVVGIQKRKVAFPPMYLYKFSYDNGRSVIKKILKLDYPGACHADELEFLFYPYYLKAFIDTEGLTKASAADRTVIERFTRMWSDFAKTGNPTPTVSELISVIWRPVGSGKEIHYLNIDEDLQMRSGDAELEKYWAWKRIENKL